MRSGTFGVVPALALAGLLAASGTAAQPVLEEVLVTAQKREQRLQDVPLAVMAISGEALQAQAVGELEALAGQLPNLHVSESAIGDKLFIRGIGSGVNAGFEQSVGTFVDGVYHGRSLQSRAQFLDIERIEVLRGPQSTYFGNNAIAGALNITTRQPSSRFSGYLNSYHQAPGDEYHVQAAVGGAVSDTVAIRVAGIAGGLDGWVSNRLTGQREGDETNSAGRISLAYAANDNFSALLKLEAGTYATRGRNLQIQDCPPVSGAAGTCRLLTEALPAVAGSSAPLFADFDNTFDLITAYNGPVPPSFTDAVSGIGAREAGMSVPAPAASLSARDRSDLGNRNATLTLNWDLRGHTLTAISGYSRYGFDLRQASDFVPVPLAAIRQREYFSQLRQELRLSSTAFGAIEYMAGIYHHSGKLGVQERIGFYLPPPWFQPAASWSGDSCRTRARAGDPSCRLPATIALASADHNQHETSRAVFGAFTWHFSPAWRIALSARYASIGKQLARVQTLDDIAPGVTVACPAVTAALSGCIAGTPLLLTADSPPRGRAFGWQQGSLELQRRDRRFSPAISLQWARSKLMLYGSYTEGFKAGGFDQRNLFLDEPGGQFGPENVAAWELGMKAAALNDSLALNLALFQSRYDNLQISTFDGIVNFLVNNAASARTRGIETDLRWRLSDKFVASASIARLDARWRDFRNAQCRAVDLAQALTGRCTIDADSGLLVQDLSGGRMLMSPRWSASFNLAWTLPLNRGFDLQADLFVYLQDEQYLAADNDPATLQDAYSKVNLRAAVISDKGWELALVIRNLTNELTAGHADDLPLGSVNSFFRLTDRPRAVALQARFHW